MSVKFNFDHSVLGTLKEQAFPLDSSISKVKDRLYLVCGTEPKNQKLSLVDTSGIPGPVIENDQMTLAEAGLYCFSLQFLIVVGVSGPGFTLYVQDVDTTGTVAGLQDVSQVEKYNISEESYGQRENFRKFISAKKPTAAATAPEEEPTHIQVGMKCKVLADEGELPGTVRYVGKPDFAAGYWIGTNRVVHALRR